jgi:glycosyltransferase involved in cell wall biosynthesis
LAKTDVDDGPGHMHVALDATPLTVETGGIGRYTAELTRALAEAFPDDVYTLVSDQPFEMPPDCPPNAKRGGAPRNRLERFWWSWGLGRELGRSRAHVFHGTDFSAPYFARVPSVMTVHDLSPWMDPGWHHGAARVRQRAPLLLGLGIAAMVVTVSEAVRRAAIERFRLNPARVAAIPNAASAMFRPVPAPPGKPYFLYVGTLEPRKNLGCLLEAWTAIREKHDVDLVLAGRRRDDCPPLEARPGLHLLGAVPDQELSALYSGALAFTYPSFYEGFGLPVLEAMQCGAMALVSNDPALREVTGDAAVHLDARAPREWAEAMDAALNRPEWVARMRARALNRAREFSWHRTAVRTREVYEQACRLVSHS